MTTSTKVVSFILYSLDGSKSLTMSNVFVLEEVPYTYSPCRDLSKYPHLSDIPISPVHPPHIYARYLQLFMYYLRR